MTDPTLALEELRARLRAARAPMRIVGSDSKRFLGRQPSGEPVSTAALSGILAYEPSELVLTAWSGTPLREIEATLTGKGQMLAFEPPHFGETATLGGTIACGLSGPCRPYAGSARDFVLGARCLTATGESLRFGGQVMKNVAGYDVSRLLVGSMGTLAVITEVSLKVLPRPQAEATVRMELPVAPSIVQMNALAARPLPLSAAAYDDDTLWLRFSGAASAVDAACRDLGGERVDDAAGFWAGLREHRLPYFEGSTPLWRLSLPPASEHLPLRGDWLIDWGGAQRWLRSDVDAQEIRTAARIAGGHATLFRHGDRGGEVFTPLDRLSLRLHRDLRASFDPAGMLDAGRMYAALAESRQR
jgi:glycolate oxidase FAD binding subunit